VIVGAADYVRAWGSADPSAYEIQIDTGIDPSTERVAVQRALGGPKSKFVVETADERLQHHSVTAREGLSRLSDIRLLVLIAGLLAVAGATGAMIWQRRDLVAFIKCHGYRRSVLWRWLLFECSMLLSAGCLVGSIFGLVGQLLISHALAVVTGFPVVFDIGPLVAFSNFALLTIAAVVIVAVAGYLVVRVPPRTVSPAY
jgi:predicted lysophospholipase L1 biosynthesis ABC-type transport system permease subunit